MNFENAPLIYSNKFKNYLKNMLSIERLNGNSDSVINMLLSHEYTENDITFVDITDSEDIISFVPISKTLKYFKSNNISFSLKKEFIDNINAEAKLSEMHHYIKNYNGLWNRHRYYMKIGRFLKKIINNVSDSDIEIFVNQYKALYKIRKSPKFEIVKGDDINKWYNEDNYLYSSNGKEGLGTLGKSCMRYGDNFFDLYTKNEDVCSLLILKSDNLEKIIGRALIWKTSSGDIYLDRVYTHFDSDYYLFKMYAKERGWLMYDVDVVNNLSVDLVKNKYSNYPYLDTFFIMDTENNKLMTNCNCTKYISLRRTDGSFDNY